MGKFTIREIFKIHGGNSVLTEKTIYENQAINPQDNISVFSSANVESLSLPKVDKNFSIGGKAIKSFSKDKRYIIIARNGKAGLMNIIEGLDFTINDHAYIMEVKKPFVNKINLEYFILKYRADFLDFVSNKDGNGTFSKEIAENYEIELIDIKEQNDFIKEYKKTQNLMDKIKKSISVLDKQLEKNIKINHKTKKFLICELFKVTSGKRIVEKDVYSNPGELPIVSAQTDNTFLHADKKWLSTFTKNGKSLIFNQPCIAWVCVGKAGSMFYRDFEFFLTDNAGVLIPKSDKINLKWFIATYQKKIRDLRQGDREGQSTMFTEHMSNIEVEIPVNENNEINTDLQNKIYLEYEKLINLKSGLENIIKKL